VEMEIKKEINIVRNGVELKIICKLEDDEISILVEGEGIKHDYPKASKVLNGTLYLNDCTYKGKKLSGIRDVEGLQEWYDEAKKIIEEKEKAKLEEEIKKDKEVKEVEFSIDTYYGVHTSNEYLKSLGFNNLSEKEIKELEKIGKRVDVDMGDYNITSYYVAPMDKLVLFLKDVKAKRKEDKIKDLEKRISEIKDRIENKNVPYKNIYFVDVDLSSGISYYTFAKRVDIKDFNKVRKYFEYIKPYENDYDPMYGSKFKGYATRNPEKVCDILYPGWREEGLEKLKKELEVLQKELKEIA